MSSSKSIARSKENEATLARQQKQLEALTEALQKVSAQLELNNSALQTVQSLIESRFLAPNKSALATRMRRKAGARARRRVQGLHRSLRDSERDVAQRLSKGTSKAAAIKSCTCDDERTIERPGRKNRKSERQSGTEQTRNANGSE